MTSSITVQDLSRLIASGSPITLLDVRREADVMASESKIGGSLWRSPGSVSTWEKAVPRQVKTVVYCVKGGQVSQSVAKTLSPALCH